MERPIGKTIREARMARGLNQQVLADLAGVATRTLSSVESRQAGMGMTVDTLVRLADALELDAGDVLKGAIGKQISTAPIARERRQLRREAAVRDRMQRLSTRWGTVVGRVWFPEALFDGIRIPRLLSIVVRHNVLRPVRPIAGDNPRPNARNGSAA